MSAWPPGPASPSWPVPESGAGAAVLELDARVLNIADAITPAGSSSTTLTATAAQAAGSDDLAVTLTNNVISNDPLTGWHWDFIPKDLDGAVTDIDLLDILRTIVRLNVLAPITDLWVGLAIVNSTTGNGWASRLAAVAGDWQAQHAVSAAGTFGAWVTATSDGDTQGFIGQLAGRGSGTTQARYNTIATDAIGVDQVGTTSTITTTGSNTGGDFDRLRLSVGMIAGGLMAAPQTITIKPAYLTFKLGALATYARFFR